MSWRARSNTGTGEVLELTRMTKKGIQALCKKNKLYQTPELNDILYLHYQGYRDIECLEEYTGLKCLWLENNAISEIQGLDHQKLLRCLFLNNNLIKKIENLEHCPELDTLNLANNHINRIENCGIEQLPVLTTLILSHNYFRTAEQLQDLVNCKMLSVLDLSHNRIEDILVVKIFSQIPELRVLDLDGNPVINKIPQYRKTLILECLNLTHLDRRPVFPRDRACAEAWKRGGYDEERREHTRWNKAERKRIRDSVNATLRLRNRGGGDHAQVELIASSSDEDDTERSSAPPKADAQAQNIDDSLSIDEDIQYVEYYDPEALSELRPAREARKCQICGRVECNYVHIQPHVPAPKIVEDPEDILEKSRVILDGSVQCGSENTDATQNKNEDGIVLIPDISSERYEPDEGEGNAISEEANKSATKQQPQFEMIENGPNNLSKQLILENYDDKPNPHKDDLYERAYADYLDTVDRLLYIESNVETAKSAHAQGIYRTQENNAALTANRTNKNQKESQTHKEGNGEVKNDFDCNPVVGNSVTEKNLGDESNSVSKVEKSAVYSTPNEAMQALLIESSESALKSENGPETIEVKRTEGTSSETTFYQSLADKSSKTQEQTIADKFVEEPSPVSEFVRGFESNSEIEPEKLTSSTECKVIMPSKISNANQAKAPPPSSEKKKVRISIEAHITEERTKIRTTPIPNRKGRKIDWKSAQEKSKRSRIDHGNKFEDMLDVFSEWRNQFAMDDADPSPMKKLANAEQVALETNTLSSTLNESTSSAVHALEGNAISPIRRKFEEIEECQIEYSESEASIEIQHIKEETEPVNHASKCLAETDEQPCEFQVISPKTIREFVSSYDAFLHSIEGKLQDLSVRCQTSCVPSEYLTNEKEHDTSKSSHYLGDSNTQDVGLLNEHLKSHEVKEKVPQQIPTHATKENGIEVVANTVESSPDVLESDVLLVHLEFNTNEKFQSESARPDANIPKSVGLLTEDLVHSESAFDEIVAFDSPSIATITSSSEHCAESNVKATSQPMHLLPRSVSLPTNLTDSEHLQGYYTDEGRRNSELIQRLINNPLTKQMNSHQVCKDIVDTTEELLRTRQINQMKKMEQASKVVNNVYLQKDLYDSSIDIVDNKVVLVPKILGQNILDEGVSTLSAEQVEKSTDCTIQKDLKLNSSQVAANEFQIPLEGTTSNEPKATNCFSEGLRLLAREKARQSKEMSLDSITEEVIYEDKCVSPAGHFHTTAVVEKSKQIETNTFSEETTDHGCQHSSNDTEFMNHEIKSEAKCTENVTVHSNFASTSSLGDEIYEEALGYPPGTYYNNEDHSSPCQECTEDTIENTSYSCINDIFHETISSYVISETSDGPEIFEQAREDNHFDDNALLDCVAAQLTPRYDFVDAVCDNLVSNSTSSCDVLVNTTLESTLSSSCWTSNEHLESRGQTENDGSPMQESRCDNRTWLDSLMTEESDAENEDSESSPIHCRLNSQKGRYTI